MKIEVKIDAACTEPEVIIVTDRLTDEINSLIKKITEQTPQMLAGFNGENVSVLDPSDIIRVYAGSGRVTAVTERGEYNLRLRLYEVEERLSGDRFVRISNSEMINLTKVRGFDLSFAGTICVTMTNGAVTYVSRRYVSRIKQVLGI